MCINLCYSIVSSILYGVSLNRLNAADRVYYFPFTSRRNLYIGMSNILIVTNPR